MKRIAFVTNIVAHYRLSFYRRLSAALARDGYELRVFHGFTERDSARPALTPDDDCGFARAPIRNRLAHLGPFTLRWQSGLLAALLRFAPQTIVVPGIVGVLSTWPLLIWARVTRRRVIMWVCGWEAQRPGTLAYALKRALLRLFYRLADTFVVYSTRARHGLEELGVKPADIRIAFNGLDVEQALAHAAAARRLAREHRRQTGVEQRRLFLYVGALLREKRVDLLLNAFARLNQPSRTALWIVGDGPEREALQAQAKTLDMPSIIFWGRIVDEADAFFAACDAFVLPGIGGLALNQAMFFGKPCICAQADGTEDDLVVDGVTGWRFRPDDPQSLALALAAATAADNDDLENRGQAARALVLQRSNVACMVETFRLAILA
jgi:glycosyltransferase involved in cell wall biosynthesis